MASSTFNVMLGGCGGLVQDLTKHAGVYRNHKASVSLRRPRQFGLDASCRRIHNSGMKSFSRSSSDCFLAKAFSYDDISIHPAQPLENSFTLPNSNTLDHKPLKMVSGSSYLPHPAKLARGGDDAHFICVDEQVIGVADGGGGWTNGGMFARELVSNIVRQVQVEPKGSFNPSRVLKKAHSNSIIERGSSTVCIIALTNEELNAINLGDSGFIVIRGGSIIFKSPVQRHGINCPYQLGNYNHGNGVLSSFGEVFTIPVAPGDVIVAGTDGLFDNLYTNDIIAVIESAIRARLEPQVTALRIAAFAQEWAHNKNWLSPFSAAALEAEHYFFGGKLDDITVVVSYISSNSVSVMGKPLQKRVLLANPKYGGFMKGRLRNYMEGLLAKHEGEIK